MTHPLTNFIAKLAVAIIATLAFVLLDSPLFGVNLPWWVCALAGLVLGFGGWFLIVRMTND